MLILGINGNLPTPVSVELFNKGSREIPRAPVLWWWESHNQPGNFKLEVFKCTQQQIYQNRPAPLLANNALPPEIILDPHMRRPWNRCTRCGSTRARFNSYKIFFNFVDILGLGPHILSICIKIVHDSKINRFYINSKKKKTLHVVLFCKITFVFSWKYKKCMCTVKNHPEYRIVLEYLLLIQGKRFSPNKYIVAIN